MRLVDKVDFSVMYRAEKESEGRLFDLVGMTEDLYVSLAKELPSIGFEIDGSCVGGMFINGNRIHLSVMPEYYGKWGWLFTPAFKWAFTVSDPLYAYVSRDNEMVLRFIRRHDWRLLAEKGSAMIFELTDKTTRYPK